jgi:hypothetical protein
MIRKLSDWLLYKQWQRAYLYMTGVKSQLTFKEFLKEINANQ